MSDLSTRAQQFNLIKNIMTSSILMSRHLGTRRALKKKADAAQSTRSTAAGRKNSSTTASADSIDELVHAWQRERPDLEAWPFAIFGRIWRLSANLLANSEQWLEPIGLTFESFSVIVTLRRAGAPYEMNPTALYRESLLSSGAITNRIDRVEAEGLVKRLPDPNDRRGTIVRLTPKGRALADRAIRLHFDALAQSLSGLATEERAQLTSLLGKLLLSVEDQKRKSPNTARKAKRYFKRV